MTSSTIDAGGMFTTNSPVARMFSRVSRFIQDARTISSRGLMIGVMFDQGATFLAPSSETVEMSVTGSGVLAHARA